MGKQSKEPQWSRNKADFPLPPKPSITKEEGPRTKAGGASKNAAYNGPCCAAAVGAVLGQIARDPPTWCRYILMAWCQC